ncbi:MAG: hypothetical protein FWE01_01115 [Firmicutes bacterium]|nr:hypothetical protein [Bacillota bacterium]
MATYQKKRECPVSKLLDQFTKEVWAMRLEKVELQKENSRLRKRLADLEELDELLHTQQRLRNLLNN